MNKIVVFKCLLENFETEKMRLYCEDMINQIPDYIFTMPSSTTGKWHNKTQCLPHGQIYHVIMFGTIANYRLGLKYNQEKYPDPVYRDAIRCVAIFHDSLKCGDGTSSFTVHEHPLLAAEWVRNAKVEHDINTDIKELIANCCASHSGQWTTAKRGSKTVLPEPQNDAEMFCHECDYLASRNDIDMAIPEYLNDIFQVIDEKVIKEIDIDTYTLSFGKYSGQRLLDIYYHHSDYIDWMEENIQRQEVLDAIKALRKKIDEDEDEL